MRINVTPRELEAAKSFHREMVARAVRSPQGVTAQLLEVSMRFLELLDKIEATGVEPGEDLTKADLAMIEEMQRDTPKPT